MHTDDICIINYLDLSYSDFFLCVCVRVDNAEGYTVILEKCLCLGIRSHPANNKPSLEFLKH